MCAIRLNRLYSRAGYIAKRCTQRGGRYASTANVPTGHSRLSRAERRAERRRVRSTQRPNGALTPWAAKAPKAPNDVILSRYLGMLSVFNGDTAMPRKREIVPGEASLWLGVLLDAVFDPTSQVVNLVATAEAMNRTAPPSTLRGGWSARGGRSELLAIASDLNDYPNDYPPTRAAELLLAWSERWLTTDDWRRLQARVRKRRQRFGTYRLTTRPTSKLDVNG
jgi:hypothetical protein